MTSIVPKPLVGEQAPRQKAHLLRRYRKTLRRLVQNRLTVLGMLIILVYLVAAAFPDLFTDYDPLKQDLTITLEPPSRVHPLGTDQFGRDVLARILYGARLSISIGFFAVSSGSIVGFLLGMLSGYFGGKSDTIIMRLMDVLLALPGIILAIAIIAALGKGAVNLIIAIGIYNIPQFARMTRSNVLAIKDEDYVLAAHSIGNSHAGILIRHILPNAISAPLIFATLRFSSAILIASGLSFLGLGIDPPTPEWGSMLAESRNYLRTAPHLAFAYGISLTILVLGFNSLGEGFRDLFDPKTVR